MFELLFKNWMWIYLAIGCIHAMWCSIPDSDYPVRTSWPQTLGTILKLVTWPI